MPVFLFRTTSRTRGTHLTLSQLSAALSMSQSCCRLDFSNSFGRPDSSSFSGTFDTLSLSKKFGCKVISTGGAWVSGFFFTPSSSHSRLPSLLLQRDPSALSSQSIWGSPSIHKKVTKLWTLMFFWKKSKRPLPPPPLFGNSSLQIFRKYMLFT